MVEAIIDKYGPGDDESFDFIAVPRRRHQESTSSESGNETLSWTELSYLYLKKITYARWITQLFLLMESMKLVNVLNANHFELKKRFFKVTINLRTYVINSL